MTAVYIILGIIAFLIAIQLLPITFHIRYRDKLLVRLRYAGIPFTVYPRKKKKKPEKAAKKSPKNVKKENSEDKLSELEQRLKEGGVSAAVDYLSDMVKLLTKAVRRVLAAVSVDLLRFRLVVASGDAAATATDYGKACAVVYPAQALIEGLMRVKRRQVEVIPDFTRESGEVLFEAKLHVLPICLIWAALRLIAEYVTHTLRKQDINPA